MHNQAPTEVGQRPSSKLPVETHRVYMLGSSGVGKAALVSQFTTSECINAYEESGKIDLNMRYQDGEYVFYANNKCEFYRKIKH